MKQLFLLLIVIAFTPLSALAQTGNPPLNTTLEEENQRADDKEMKVRELARKAGHLSTKLSGIEKDIRSLMKNIRAQEKALTEIRANEEKTRKNYCILEKEKQQITLELSGLMKTLWPVHLQKIRTRFANVDSWDVFDRRFTWLAEIYEATRRKLEEAKVNSQRIASNLERQRILEEEAENQLARINKSKDRLLNNKYSLRKKLRKVSKQRKTVEAELHEILGTIEELKYQLQSQKTKRFSLYKRMLPWPVKGQVVSGFNLRAKPPVRGLVMATNDGATVQSIFWGKIVHNDTLRGFGHVIIIYHGYNYYSLYAYLSHSNVRNGQEVEKNEPLGVVGYNPKINGPGIYFELRFHQKPINPKRWLTALQ